MRWLSYSLNRDGTLEEAIKRIVKAYYREHKRLPRAIAVHPTRAAEARQAARTLALNVPIRPTGGCLAGELWLGVEAP